MKIAKVFTLTLSWLTLSSALFSAAVVKVNFDSGGYDIKDLAGTSLTAGANSVAGDGAIIQLGYFTGATGPNAADNNFVGQFIPITGDGSANLGSGAQFDTTIGDDPTAGFGPPFAGQFQLTVIFTPAGQPITPPIDARLSIRIFDKASLSTPDVKFLTLSNNSWKWFDFRDSTSPTSSLNISLADTGTRFENRNAAGGLVSTPNGSAATGDERPFIGVPEPSSILLLGAVGIVSFARRNRK